MRSDRQTNERTSQRDTYRRLLQSAAAFVIGLAIALPSGWTAMRAAASVVEPAPIERINPNTAAVASLMRLPGIGRVRAMDIVSARRQTAFTCAADLERVRGIGPKTVEKIEPYLVFERE